MGNSTETVVGYDRQSAPQVRFAVAPYVNLFSVLDYSKKIFTRCHQDDGLRAKIRPTNK